MWDSSIDPISPSSPLAELWWLMFSSTSTVENWYWWLILLILVKCSDIYSLSHQRDGALGNYHFTAEVRHFTPSFLETQRHGTQQEGGCKPRDLEQRDDEGASITKWFLVFLLSRHDYLYVKANLQAVWEWTFSAVQEEEASLGLICEYQSEHSVELHRDDQYFTLRKSESGKKSFL